MTSNIEWSVNDDANVSVEKSNELLRYYTFKKSGKYNIKVVVTAAGKKTETAVNIEVPKQDSLSITDDPTEQSSLKINVSETPRYVKAYDSMNFSFSFDNSEQLAWYRVVYSWNKDAMWGEKGRKLISVDETDGYKVSFVPYSYRSSGENEHTVTVQAFDWYGNMYEEKRTFIVDDSAPDASVSASTTYSYCGQPVIIKTSAKDDNSGLKSVTLTCNDEPVQIDENGEYTFTAEGTDKTGYTDSVVFKIQAASAYEAEIGSKDMEKYLAETPETSLNDKLKNVADGFNGVVDAYSYVMNNIAYEAYINSRRGAVGAFELKRANDMDQASLLIGFCRYMGVPARYETSTVRLNEEQVKSLMAMQDFESACQLLNTAGKSVVINRTAKTANFEETRVQVYVPYSMIGVTDNDKKDLGLWVSLDTAIKASELKEYAVDSSGNQESLKEIENIYKNYRNTEIKDLVNQLPNSYSGADKI